MSNDFSSDFGSPKPAKKAKPAKPSPSPAGPAPIGAVQRRPVAERAGGSFLGSPLMLGGVLAVLVAGVGLALYSYNKDSGGGGAGKLHFRCLSCGYEFTVSVDDLPDMPDMSTGIIRKNCPKCKAGNSAVPMVTRRQSFRPEADPRFRTRMPFASNPSNT